MDVSFEVSGRGFVLAEQQATILAENLRILSRADSTSEFQVPTLPGSRSEWRDDVELLADQIERALVELRPDPLQLKGDAADATYAVLRLMVGLDRDGASGLRDALGEPVRLRRVAREEHVPLRRRIVAEAVPSKRPSRSTSFVRHERMPHLSRPEFLELLTILFVLAVVTFVAGTEWTGTWYILAPMIAGLLGLRVATTRVTGSRFAWMVGSVVWWGLLLVPAAVLVTLCSLLVFVIIHS